MFEEIEKRVLQAIHEWRLSCLAGDELQAAFCRGAISELLQTMKSAEQSVNSTETTSGQS